MDLALQTGAITNCPHVYTMGTSDCYTERKPGIYIQTSLSWPFIYIIMSKPLLQERVKPIFLLECLHFVI